MTKLFFLSTFLHLLIFFPPNAHSTQPQTINPIDLTALYNIKKTLTPTPFFSTWNFNSPNPCSTFTGITCSNQRVTTLTLGTGLSNSPAIAGALSNSISSLTQLTQLILNPGQVSGPIPFRVGSLVNLRVISLTNNRLTGQIPISIFTLPNLHTLDLSHNRLSGWVPPGIPTGLKVLILSGNYLWGEIPELPSGLLHLDLKGNSFSGQLPGRIPNSLKYLSLAENKMWGPLGGLDLLSELVYLDLSMNMFSGPIPGSLFRPSLSSMFLQRNNLSGRVPISDLGLYGPGSIMDLSHNMLSGELSGTSIYGVQSLFLNNNKFTGEIPREIIESVYGGTMTTLYLQHNYISVMQGFDSTLPDNVSVCLSYNCAAVPHVVGSTACPASAGEQLTRPMSQCHVYDNESSIG